MKVIKATAGDLEQIAVLFDEYRQFYKQQSDVEGARNFLRQRILNNESVIFVAKEDDVSVGFVQLYPIFSSVRMKRLWLLNDLYVKKQFRGKGLSKSLIDEAKKLARETNASGLMLETEKTNEVGNALYVSTGFVADDSHHFYFWSMR